VSYTVLDEDQCVTHAAITENKRLGEELTYIKERRDQRSPSKVKINSEKTDYKARGSKPGSSTDVMSDPVIAARRERALVRLAPAE
jgi:hypothetical protein